MTRQFASLFVYQAERIIFTALVIFDQRGNCQRKQQADTKCQPGQALV